MLIHIIAGVVLAAFFYYVGQRHGYEEGYEDAIYDYPEEDEELILHEDSAEKGCG